MTDPPTAALTSIPTSIATVSVGYGLNALPPLQEKLHAIAHAGFQGIELEFNDLLAFATAHHSRSILPTDYSALTSAASAVKSLCTSLNLRIMLLQPFAHLEGWPAGSPARADAFARLDGWISIMQALGCLTLQVGSSDAPVEQIGMNRERFVEDLREAADRLAAHGLYLAYENWCWSTHAPDWRDVWDIVRQVDRDNVGLCLDTFQSAGGEWADPRTASGLLEDVGAEQREQRFRESMTALAAEVPAEKIYLLQVSDAYRLAVPITEDDPETGLRPRARWSLKHRPLPYDGGYLPVAAVAAAVLGTGFRGWFSYEPFDKGPDGKGKDYDLESYAAQAMESHRQLLHACAAVVP